jgi:hypothetical protein
MRDGWGGKVGGGFIGIEAQWDFRLCEFQIVDFRFAES